MVTVAFPNSTPTPFERPHAMTTQQATAQLMTAASALSATLLAFPANFTPDISMSLVTDQAPAASVRLEHILAALANDLKPDTISAAMDASRAAMSDQKALLGQALNNTNPAVLKP